MSDVQNEVRAASDRFYAALNRVLNGDAGPMVDVWSHTDDTSVSHPMGDWSRGWDQIAITWEEFARVISRGSVEVEGLTVYVAGDFAYTLGVEHVYLEVPAGAVRFRSNVTNIFRREAGGWRLVHHHVDKAPDFEQRALAELA
jgi:ketosteroid isomerase-like protein